MSEHKKLARLVARAFYRHSSTRDRLARVGNAKYDNSRTAEVLIDALTRRAWVKEDDLARAVLLSSKQVRKALHYLEEQRIVRRAHVKEKDKEREERTRARAEENGVEEAIIAERIRAIEKKIVTYVCLDYSRVVDAVQLRLAAAHADLKYRVEKGPVSVLYKCTSDAEVCGKRYSSLDAMRLLDPTTGLFTCQVCRGEVVQLGGGEDGAPPEPRTKEGMKAILAKFETQTAPVLRQLAKVRGLTPPQYGTLNEWTRARRRAFANAAGNGGQGLGSNGQGLGSGGGMAINVDNLEDTTFEVTLGLTEEQEAELEAAANPKKAQPEWLKGSVYVDDEQTETNEANDDETKEETEEDRLKKNEEAIKEEWLRAYLEAIKGAGAAPGDDDGATAADVVGGGGEMAKSHASTDALVDAAVDMADAAADDEEWDDVEEDWEDA